MEFEEFARRFRERAAKRMLEFEVALEQSRRDLEKAAEKKPETPHGGSTRPAAQSETWGAWETRPAAPGVTAIPPTTLSSLEQTEGAGHRRVPEHRPPRGPVQGVLKRN